MKTKGFTLIELLVVIAIIGILSSVVLASLTTARSRGVMAAVQSELSNMRAQAELYYSTTGGNSYLVAGATTPVTTCNAGSSMFSGTNSVANLITGITAKAGAPTCYASASTWSVSATANSVVYCVDSTGYSGTSTVAASVESDDGACNNS